jgi:hypothetical protein
MSPQLIGTGKNSRPGPISCDAQRSARAYALVLPCDQRVGTARSLSSGRPLRAGPVGALAHPAP